MTEGGSINSPPFLAAFSEDGTSTLEVRDMHERYDQARLWLVRNVDWHMVVHDFSHTIIPEAARQADGVDDLTNFRLLTSVSSDLGQDPSEDALREGLEQLELYQRYCIAAGDKLPEENPRAATPELRNPNLIPGVFSWVRLTQESLIMLSHSSARFAAAQSRFHYLITDVSSPLNRIHALLDSINLGSDAHEHSSPSGIVGAVQQEISAIEAEFDAADAEVVASERLKRNQEVTIEDGEYLEANTNVEDASVWIREVFEAFPSSWSQGLSRVKFVQGSPDQQMHHDQGSGDAEGSNKPEFNGVRGGNYNINSSELRLYVQDVNSHYERNKTAKPETESDEGYRDGLRRAVESTTRQVAYHELTHHAACFVFSMKDLRDFVKVCETQPVDVTPYVEHVRRTTPGWRTYQEDIAETVAMYKTNPGKLYRMSPGRFALATRGDRGGCFC